MVIAVLMLISAVITFCVNFYYPLLSGNNENKAKIVGSVSCDDFDDGILACAEFLSGNNVYNNSFVAEKFTFYGRASAVESLNSKFEKHLQKLWGEENPPYSFLSGDFDNDGQTEYLFALGNCGRWAEYTRKSKALAISTDYESFYGKANTIFIYCDVYEKVAVYQLFVSSGCSCDVNLCLWDCDRLNIETGSGNKTFFVCDAKTTYTGKSELLMYRMENYLNLNEYSFIRYSDASFCSGMGKQCVFVYGKDENKLNATVYVFYAGRAIPVYTVKSKDKTALYYIDRNGYIYFLTYKNWVSKGYACYEYQKFSFDNNYSVNIIDSQTVSGKDAKNADKVTAFFEKFRVLLQQPTSVYTDPYQLTGYSTNINSSNENSGSSFYSESFYLNINNCPTGKSGVVNIKADPNNWLNLRTGPGVSYKRVKVNGNIVKQARGTVVNVIDTVNTNNKENPIWVKIQIDYGGITTGYSSQKYIEFENIKHIKKGESFTVTVDTNDSGLSWTVNDSSVATIDPNGKITGKKRGLVMVTVTSLSGLTDSCLVEIG